MGEFAMRTTLKQLAEYTGLSVTTVSLVLNGKPCRVSDESRALILEAAEKLKYRRNMVAVSLVKGKTNTIGLIISDIRNSFFSTLAKGVGDECQKHGWNMMICNTNDRHAMDMEDIQMMAGKGVNGIVWGMASETTAGMAHEAISLLERENIPYLLIDRYVKTEPGRTIRVDHRLGGYLATRHLIELGHRRIACVTGPSNLIDSEARMEGYLQALEEADIPCDGALVYEGNYQYAGGVEAVRVLQARGAAYTALFAFNDMMAFGCMKQLRSMGMAIPGDVSVVGYDNVFFSDLLDVPLTTVNQPVYEMGLEAARQLILEPRDGGGTHRTTVFNPTLVPRETSGPVSIQ